MSDQPVVPVQQVTLPFDYFADLQSAADNSPPPTIGERTASTLQTTIIFGAIATAVAGGSWGWAKAMDWLEEKNFRRRLEEDDRKEARKKTPPQ